MKVGAPNSNIKKDVSSIPPMNDPKESICYYFQNKGHWKHSCPKYLVDLKKNKGKVIGTSCMFTIGLHAASTSNNWIQINVNMCTYAYPYAYS